MRDNFGNRRDGHSRGSRSGSNSYNSRSSYRDAYSALGAGSSRNHGSSNRQASVGGSSDGVGSRRYTQNSDVRAHSERTRGARRSASGPSQSFEHFSQFNLFGVAGVYAVAFAMFVVIALIACGRLIWVQLIDSEGIQGSSGGQAVQTYTIPAVRGTIYDCNGTILATTIDTINIFCHPHMLTTEQVDTVADFLVENCGGKKADYTEKLTASKNFQYLYKNADESLKAKITALGIEGLDYEKSNKRIYPCGSIGSQVIGTLTTGENNELTGVTGLERYYNDILAGSSGERVATYSRDGVLIPGSSSTTKEAVAGKDIVVSIDIEMQEAVEKALEVNAKSVSAETESGIVMDASTGEIVACAGSPTFDITDTSKVKEGATNMNGINFAYEPGSVFKPAIMLAALEAGTTKAGQNYYCPSSLKVGDFTISDSHDRGAETMDTTKIIADSSNVGMSLISKDLGAKKMAKYIERYGLTGKTGVDYPAEASGKITDYKDWSKAQQYNISFGQGVTTSGISLVRFYGALANNGVANTPHFLVSIPSDNDTKSYDSEEIVKNKKALKSLIKMMQAVVDEGTATDAAIDGYKIAGKTGTAQTVNSDGEYGHGVYNISFCGFIPGASKNLVCYVGATQVPGMYQTVSAFKDIMTFAIERYNITQE